MWWLNITSKVLCVIVLLVSGATTLSLSKFVSAERDKGKREAMALGVLMSLILFVLMFYKVVII